MEANVLNGVVLGRWLCVYVCVCFFFFNKRIPMCLSSIFGIPKYPHKNSEITYSLVYFFFPTKKVKSVILSCVKTTYSYPYSSLWFPSIFIIYLNSNTSIIFIKKIQNYFFQKKKKKCTTSPKNYLFLSQNFYGFFFFFLNIPKFLLSRSYTVITNPHLSTLMYIIFFCSNLKFFNLSQFLS